VVGNTRLYFEPFAFDVSRLSDSTDITARLSGNLDADPEKGVQVNARFTSLEDFDLRVACARITADDVNVFLPASERLVETGVVQPSIRVAGYPGTTLVVSCEAPFSDLSVRGHPDFLGPLKGLVTGLASYDVSTRLLSLSTAKANAEQLSGSVDGTISFAGDVPALDLRMEANEFPIRAVLDSLLAGYPADYAALDLQLDAPYKVEVLLRGTSETPAISARVNVDAGKLGFQPKDERYPSGELELGPVAITWDSESASTEGSLTVVSGALTFTYPPMAAEKLSGVFRLKDGTVACDPLNMVITGNPFVGSVAYDTAKNELALGFSGEFSHIEDTMFGTALKDLSLAGSVSVRCRMAMRESQYVFDGEFDATQAQVDYEWWFRKPPGVGASGREVHVEVAPQRAIAITGRVEVASTPVEVRSVVAYKQGKWRHESLRCSSESVDVTSAGKCICIPYTVVGGVGSKAHFLWERAHDRDAVSRMTIGGAIDEVSLLPAGSDVPLQMKGVNVEITSVNGKKRTATVSLAADDGRMPPLNGVWFLPLKTDPTMRERYPDHGREWNYRLEAKSLEVPPWKGLNFEGTAWSDSETTGLKRFSADIVGGGRLEGDYRRQQAENAYELHAEWKEMPAFYLIQHLNYPNVLEGVTSGRVSYSLDRDDPSTLTGSGSFEIRDGQFSADFLLSRFQSQLQNEVASLPPSLKFSKVVADVGFRGDTVEMPRLELAAEGIRLEGSGRFIRDGDMDYEVRVSLSPEAAQRIPALRDALNVEGHRLAQRNIDLVFRVAGPTSNPQGELAEPPPVGVTLVSGALEVTSEAMKMIDLPRRLLVDLLKTAGGIVASKK
jgi:hypothetical protein